MKELILKLSDSECIKIIPDYDRDFKEVDYCCSFVKVYLSNEKDFRIGQESAGEVFEHFIRPLKKAIKNDLQLDISLNQNLGIMLNQYYQDKPSDFVQVSSIYHEGTHWIGLNYHLFSSFGDAKPQVSTWLYNDDNGDIILEVTKDYPWHFVFDEKDYDDLEYITYDEFMKDYKPLIQRVIPREVAIMWVEQLMEVYRGLFEKEEHFIRRSKEMGW
jgi:hypothetical protein